MVKITNIFGDRYSGQAGKAGVFANWKGRQYRRSYVIPANPNTTKQQSVRNNLKNGVIRWHLYCSTIRKAYAYMAAGLVMSGFNLLVRRWQKAMPDSDTAMVAPTLGIKQIGHTKDEDSETAPAPTAHEFSLGHSPCVIGSGVFTKGVSGVAMDAYVEKDQGYIRIPVAINDAEGAKGSETALEAGDQLLISYEASGRIVTREVLVTLAGAETEFPAAATMAAALQTKYFPIDWGTVKIETNDVDGGENQYTQLESLEIDSRLGLIYYDLTDSGEVDDDYTYDWYVPYEDAKLEATKSDTSFISWRDYSDAEGFLPIAQTAEDEAYDLVYTYTGQTPVLATGKTAALAALTEFVDMGAPA